MRNHTTVSDLQQSVFHLKPEDTNGTLFVYAASILPTSRLVNTSCEVCGCVSEIPEGSFDVVVEGGRQFPDLLYCGAYPFLIVSARVVDDWERSNINDFSRFTVRVKDLTDAQVKLSDAPEYFRIEVSGSCEVDLRRSGLALRKRCRSCGCGRIDRLAEKGYVVKARSLKGSGLFRDSILSAVIFCSSTVSDLATANHHSNVKLQSVQLI